MEVDRVMRMAWKDRPVVLMVSFLLLTSPLFPLVLYFFPLIMSTALCTIALVSIVPHETESELLEQIVGEIHNADSSDEATASHLRSYATWLQWLMGMDRSDQICSDIPSTSSCQEPYYLTATTDAPTEQLLEACGASHDEESVMETILTTAIESEINYSVEDLFDPFEEECSIQESKFCEALRTQLAFDFIPDLQKITMQVQNLIRGSSKWLSMLTVDRAVRWFRETLREEKLHRDMYGPLLMSERITVHLREDSEQQIFSLAEDYNKKITLAKEPAGVEACTFLSQIGQLDSSFDSIIGLRDSCSSNDQSSIWMEDDSSCSCEEIASDCSDCDLDTFSLTDLDLISTVRSSIHEAQSEKEEQSASNQIIEPKSIISEFISKEGFSPDATEIIASREHEPCCDEQLTVDQKKIVADISQTDTNMCVRKSSLDSFSSCGQSQTDTKVDRRERGDAHQERFAPMLNASVPKSMTVQEDCPLISVQTVIEASSSPKDRLALHHKNLISSLENCRKPVNSWPTVQKVLASRTKESFPSVMRTGNPLSSGSNLSTSGSLRAIKIKL